MQYCNYKQMAIELFIVGTILILVRLYSKLDIWIVVGGILVLKGIFLFVTGKNSDSAESRLDNQKES